MDSFYIEMIYTYCVLLQRRHQFGGFQNICPLALSLYVRNHGRFSLIIFPHLHHVHEK